MIENEINTYLRTFKINENCTNIPIKLDILGCTNEII